MPDEARADAASGRRAARVAARGAARLTLDKVGDAEAEDVNKLSIGRHWRRAREASTTPSSCFAPAQFQNFSDADKLSKPAFSTERSGLDLSACRRLRSTVMVRRELRYEEIIIDSNFKRFHRRFRGFFGALFDFFLHGAAVRGANSRPPLMKRAALRRQDRGGRRDVHGRIRSRPTRPSPATACASTARRAPRVHARRVAADRSSPIAPRDSDEEGRMSSSANYSFLPWLRQGLANQIQSADFDASVRPRAASTCR